MFNSDPDKQVPILTFGFRPFFLLAGLYAVVAMLAWIIWLMLHGANAAILQPTISVPAHQWHGHEMLYGFGAAVITGFLLTAMPGWTGARRVAGAQLMFLAAVWIVGRAAMWLSSFLPAVLVAAVDMAMLVMLAAVVAFAMVQRPTPRNLIFLAVLAILIVANGAIHAEWIGWLDGTASWGLNVALLDVILLVAILGGRIVPAFTRNAMQRRQSAGSVPASYAPLDAASIASVAAVLLCFIFELPDAATGVTAALAALLNGIRLGFWRFAETLDEPILWSLFLAYFWIPVGLIGLSASAFTAWISQTSALHLLAIGTIGGMTLAMMTRAPLGHSGRPLVVRRSIAWAYLFIAGAAIVRGFVVNATSDNYYMVILAAGALWCAGFAIYSAVYLPILCGPTLKGQKAD